MYKNTSHYCWMHIPDLEDYCSVTRLGVLFKIYFQLFQSKSMCPPPLSMHFHLSSAAIQHPLSTSFEIFPFFLFSDSFVSKTLLTGLSFPIQYKWALLSRTCWIVSTADSIFNCSLHILFQIYSLPSFLLHLS